MKATFKWAMLASAGFVAAPGAHAQDEADQGGVAEIVVTAQKRAESSQRIPITIEAVTSDKIATAGVDNLIAAQKLTPGVVFSRAPDAGVQLTFRGLGTPARNTSFEQSVGGFQDGVFFGNPAMYSAPFFDVQRIEFIKGTQSALLGKNTSVGAISIVTRRPGDNLSFEGSISREFEFGGWTLDAGADLPLAPDFAVRVAGHYKNQDGWIRNSATGRSAISEDNAALRLVAAWTPESGANVTAIYQYVDSERSGSMLEIVTDDGLFRALDGSTSEARLDGNTSQFSSFGPNGEGANDLEGHLATAIVDIPLGSNTLTAQTSYSSLTSFSVNPVSVPGEEILTARRNQSYDQFSQELRLASPTGGDLEYILGLYYFHSHVRSVDEQFWSAPNFFIPPGLQLLKGHYVNNFNQKLNSYSGFANATFRLSDQARISGSLRYTHEAKDAVFGRSTFGPLTFWNTVANPPFAATPLRFADDFVNGNINLQYDVAPDVMVYASYGRGTKTGGYADSSSVGDANPAVSARIESETADTFEAGLKSSLFDRRMILNFAGFHTKAKNYQVTTFVAGQFVNLNVPARSYGFEAKVQARLAAGLDLDGSVTYADTADRSTGLRLVSAPVWTLDGGIRYDTPVGNGLAVTTSVRGHYRSSMFTQFNETARVSAFGTVDASIAVGAEDGGWKVFLRSANLFNAKGSDFGIDGVVDPRLGPPANANPNFRIINPLRTVEAGISVKF